MVLVVITCIACVSFTGCGKQEEQVQDKLNRYLKAVYAPDSMKEFEDAREESKDLFTSAVTNRLFVSYSNELTELDLLRSIDVITVHGKAENQSDRKERYLSKVYLYETPDSQAVIKYFTFILSTNGLVEDFTISDPDWVTNT